MVRVDNPIPVTGNGLLNNVVSGGSPGGDCPAAASCETSNLTAGYTVVKTDSAGAGAVAAGSTFTYTLTITNTGSVAFPSVTVTDNLADVLDDSVFGSGSAGVTRSGNTLTWTGPLPVSASPVVVTYTVVVDYPIPATGNGSLTNAITTVTPGGDCPGAAGCSTTNVVGAYAVTKPTRPVPAQQWRWVSR